MRLPSPRALVWAALAVFTLGAVAIETLSYFAFRNLPPDEHSTVWNGRNTQDARDTRTTVRYASDVAPVPRLAIARLEYGGGGDWYANPSAVRNLLRAVGERTALPIDRTEHKVKATDPTLFDFPYVYATGHGTMVLQPEEIARLREYLLRGGFLHVDDNYGLDSSFRIVLKQLFPDRPLVDVPLTHPIYRLVYEFPRGVPKVHEHDGKPARGLGIFIGDRLALYYTFQADLGNGWEDVGTYANDPPALHEQALRMGINLVTYAITSRVTP